MTPDRYHDKDDDESEVIIRQRTKDMLHHERLEREWQQSKQFQVESKLDSLTKSLEVMQDLMKQNGILNAAKGKGKSNKSKHVLVENPSDSRMTIYKDAVPLNSKLGDIVSVNKDIVQLHNTLPAPHRVSSSSDEIDTSDNLINFVSPDHDDIIVGHPTDAGGVTAGGVARDPGPQPSTSSGGRRLNAYSDPVPQMAGEPTPVMTHAEQQIHEAEASKAHLMDTSGKLTSDNAPVTLSFIHSAFVDEEYLVMGSHVDEAMCKKIINHEYVDFSRLLPRDHLHCEDEPQ